MSPAVSSCEHRDGNARADRSRSEGRAWASLRGRRTRAQDRSRAIVCAAELHELPGDRVVVEHVAGSDLEDPAVHLERARVEAACHEIERPQVLELDQNVLLYGGGHARLALEVAVALLDDLGHARR